MRFGSILAAFAALSPIATVLAVGECHITIWEGKTPIGTEIAIEGGEYVTIAGYQCNAGAGCTAHCIGLPKNLKERGVYHGEM
ncbi:hypothetical protein PgNI_10840 [Pyricularia grisea]|uniref:Uncharacterized protein n=1 Tax=Pyricularia grisea TaxID=148305 RepID=A0A6P8AZR6_PYRGI|nr:hypothetical protein PgNI_10840 [Pyricularia grisea]TLD07830.1 hypothetical protein PgNI_10840 [Pyricularia grisea]